MNVFARAKIHHGIGAPFCSPTHFLDFFLDRRSDGTVADVGVDLYQEIAADDHWLGFRMIDVRGDDRASASNLIADVLGGYLTWNVNPPRFSDVLVVKIVARYFRFSIFDFRLRRFASIAAIRGFDSRPRASKIFSDCDEFHLGGDDATPRVS